MIKLVATVLGLTLVSPAIAHTTIAHHEHGITSSEYGLLYALGITLALTLTLLGVLVSKRRARQRARD